MPHREGFVCAGTWCLEHVKAVAHYPAAGEQTTILREHTRAGGNAFDVLAALRRLDAFLPLYALGMIGDDEEGRALLAACHKAEADTFQLQTTSAAPTSHAIIIQKEHDETGTRFYAPGANHFLQTQHFDFKHCLARWLCLNVDGLLVPEVKVLTEIFQAARALHMSTALTLSTPELAIPARTLLPELDYLVIAAPAWRALAQETGVSAGVDLFQFGLREGFAILEGERVFAGLRSGESMDCKLSITDLQNTATLSALSAIFLYGRYSGWSLEETRAALTTRAVIG